MSLVPSHNYIDLLRYDRLKLTHRTNFCWDGMGMLWTLLGNSNTGHVSLGPKMAVPGVRSVIGCVLSALLAWNIIYTLFGRAPISRLLAVGFGHLSDPRWSTFDADHDAVHRFGPSPILWLSATHSRSDQMTLYMYHKIHWWESNPNPRKWPHWIRSIFIILIASQFLHILHPGEKIWTPDKNQPNVENGQKA